MTTYREQTTLQQAWNELQAVPSYVEQQARKFASSDTSRQITETILTWAGRSFQRIVRSQRMFKGVRVGAIHDKGYLVMVRCDGGAWTPIHTIRKLR